MKDPEENRAARGGKEHTKSGGTIVYGFHPVRELLRRQPHRIQQILIASGRTGKRRDELDELALRHRIEVRDAEAAELGNLARGQHQGFVAVLREATDTPEGSESTDGQFLLLAEDVQDPRNLGALLRVCEGAGVGRVLLRDRGSSPITPAAEKTSAGASQWVEIERIGNTGNALGALKKEGYWVYGTDAMGQPPWEIDLTGPIVICIGGEEKGLRQRTRGLCDAMIGLPMRGKIESLNLATAAAAVLYEAVRQRTK